MASFAGCQSLNPNAGRFHCETGADCGEGYECRPQFAGGGRCFKNGECVELEVCDGADQNCDGRIDETFPEQAQPCATGKLGICAAGTAGCVAGALACLQSVMPAAEECNGRDDDCDGAVDQTFDLTSDDAHCGGCNRPCLSGTSCHQASCQESMCDDGLDNDGDGAADCLDRSCLGQVCVTPLPPSWRCGEITLDAGVSDADGGLVDAGTLLGCFAPESDCANGLDDDGDGAADCLDTDCEDRVCSSGTLCSNHTCPGPG